MRVAKIRRLHARRTAENLPMSSRDRGLDTAATEPSARGFSDNVTDGAAPLDTPRRLEKELSQVPLFLRRRRL
jgi:hypothetical protein